MKKFKITLILFLFVNLLYAQNQANNWYFGHNAGITFSNNPPTFLTGGQVYSDEGSASISDANGNLLFYSDGVSVWDSTHAVMPNGTGLLGNSSSTQSALIIPAPGSNTLYYLITAPNLYSNNPLAYSIIDMTLNGGSGAVTVKNISLLDTSAEKVTAVSHQNGTDIWIIAHGYPNNNFYSFLLTSAGINPVPVLSYAGNPITTLQQRAGYLKASPCGNQLAMADYEITGISRLELFDFDNSTGIIYNALQLGQWTVQNGVYGVEFSPNNSKLYATIDYPPSVMQYDLLAGSPAAIIASMTTIGNSSFFYYGALQTGPDGRIYLTKLNTDSLACITNPNQSGNLCGYIENYISLGTATAVAGLPNFFTSIFCNISSNVNLINPEQIISLYPNPVNSHITISVQDLNLSKVSFIIYDILGQNVFNEQENIFSTSHTKTINLNFLSKGIYLLEVNIDGERTVKKIVKD